MKKGQNGKYFVFRVYLNRETDEALCDQLIPMPSHMRSAFVKAALEAKRSSASTPSVPRFDGCFDNFPMKTD